MNEPRQDIPANHVTTQDALTAATLQPNRGCVSLPQISFAKTVRRDLARENGNEDKYSQHHAGQYGPPANEIPTCLERRIYAFHRWRPHLCIQIYQRLLRIPNAWIGKHVKHVCHKRHSCEKRGKEENRSAQSVEVVLEHGFGRQTTQPRPAKNDFDDYLSIQEEGEQQGRKRKRRDERIAKGVLPDDDVG